MAAPAIRVQATDREVAQMFKRMDQRFKQSERQGRETFDTIDKHSKLAAKGVNVFTAALAGIGIAAQKGIRVAISEFEQFDIKIVRTQNLVNNMTNDMARNLGEYARLQATSTGAPRQSVFGSTFTGMSGGARDAALRQAIRVGAQANIAYDTAPTEAVMRLTQVMAQTKLGAREAMEAMVVGADIGQTDFGQLAANVAHTTVGARLLGIDQRENIGILGTGTMFAPSTAEAATQQKALYAQAVNEASPFSKEFKKVTGTAFLEAVRNDGFLQALAHAFAVIGQGRAVSLLGASRSGPYAASIAANLPLFQAGAQTARTGGGFTLDYLRASDTLYAQRARTREAGANLLLTGGQGAESALQTFLSRAEEIFNDPASHEAMEALASALGNFLTPAGQLATAFNTISGPLQLLASAKIPTPGGGVSGLDVGGTAMGIFAMSEMRQMMNNRRAAGTAANIASGSGLGPRGRQMKIVLKDDRRHIRDERYKGQKGAVYGTAADRHQAAYVQQQREQRYMNNAARTGMMHTPMGMVPIQRAPWSQRMRAGASAGWAGARAMGGTIGGGLMTAGMWGMGASMLSGLFGQITGFDPLEEAIDRMSDTFRSLTDSTFEAQKSVERFADSLRDIAEEAANILEGTVTPEEEEYESFANQKTANMLRRAIYGGLIPDKDWTIASQKATYESLLQGENTHMRGSVFRHLGLGNTLRGTNLTPQDVVGKYTLYNLIKDSEEEGAIGKAKSVKEELDAIHTEEEQRYVMAALGSLTELLSDKDKVAWQDFETMLALALTNPITELFDFLTDNSLDEAILESNLKREKTLEEIAANTATYTSIYQTVGYATPSPLYQEDTR